MNTLYNQNDPNNAQTHARTHTSKPNFMTKRKVRLLTRRPLIYIYLISALVFCRFLVSNHWGHWHLFNFSLNKHHTNKQYVSLGASFATLRQKSGERNSAWYSNILYHLYMQTKNPNPVTMHIVYTLHIQLVHEHFIYKFFEIFSAKFYFFY